MRMDSGPSSVAHGSSAYLQDCLNKQADVATALYGQRQDLERIQKLASQLRPSDTLTYAHIEQITDLKLWAGQHFWQWPTPKEFNKRLGDYPVADLWNVKGREKEVIDLLLNVFRHIEPVSVVLRFLHPNRFGILSPPVEKLLELSPSSSPAEKYLSYINDLRDIKDYCQRMKYCEFSTAAEVDMAIWTLQEVMEASRSDSNWLDQVVPEHREWIERYENDVMLREIRVRNLTKSLFGNMGLTEVAEALLSQNLRGTPEPQQLRLAGQLAGIQFEREVMELARAVIENNKDTDYVDRLRDICNDRDGRLSRMVRSGLELPSDVRQRWEFAVDFRNTAVHAPERLRPRQAVLLLQALREAARRAANERAGSKP